MSHERDVYREYAKDRICCGSCGNDNWIEFFYVGTMYDLISASCQKCGSILLWKPQAQEWSTIHLGDSPPQALMQVRTAIIGLHVAIDKVKMQAERVEHSFRVLCWIVVAAMIVVVWREFFR